MSDDPRTPAQRWLDEKLELKLGGRYVPSPRPRAIEVMSRKPMSDRTIASYERQAIYDTLRQILDRLDQIGPILQGIEASMRSTQ